MRYKSALCCNVEELHKLRKLFSKGLKCSK